MSEKDYAEIFSKNLKKMMEINDMTQLELSKRLGVASSAVNYWVKGIKNPRMDKVDKMCEIFGCKRSDLMQDHSEDESYYLNSDAKELADFMHKNPEYKGLFDAVRAVPIEDIQFVKDFIDRIKRN